MQSDYTNTLVKLEDVFGTFAYQATSSKEQIYEPTANKLIQSVSMDYAYDKYGNVLMQTATYGNGDVQKVTNTYSNNTTDWMIGLLTRSVSASTVGGNSLSNTGCFKRKQSNRIRLLINRKLLMLMIHLGMY